MFHVEPFLSPQITQLCEQLRVAGGRPFLVGGCVRDFLLGLKPKDIDIEVHGLPIMAIVAALPKDARAEEVGVQFGVVKVHLPGGEEVDLSIPRRDSKVGVGHTGFQMEFDPTMSVEEASSRRDFTMNAIMFDISTKRFIDPHGGAADIQSKTIRHTSKAFAEDPLRVLRAFQFASRFGFEVAPETIELCFSLRDEFNLLSKERVWGEWEKIGTKGRTFGATLHALKDSGWFSLFLGISHLAVQRFDRAALMCDEAGITGERRCVIMLACLAVNTRDPFRFMKSINAPVAVTDRVMRLIENQSRGGAAVRVQARQLARALHPLLTLEDSHCFQGISSDVRTAASVENVFKGPIPRFVTGDDLIARGGNPGPEFSVILSSLEDMQDSGFFASREEALAWIDGNPEMMPIEGMDRF